MSEAVDAQSNRSPSADQRIAAAVRALAAGRGIKNSELAPIIGTSRATVFAKVKGDAPWKAEEIEAVATYFGVTVGDLFGGLGIFGHDEAPRSARPRGFSSGAPSGTRTPDPLIKSQLL